MAFWISLSHGGPVVVEASTLEEADEKVHRSPLYNGFGAFIFTVEEFAEMCESGRGGLVKHHHGPRQKDPLLPLNELLKATGVRGLLTQVDERTQRIGDHIRGIELESGKALGNKERCPCEVCERLQHECLKILDKVKGLLGEWAPEENDG